VSFQLLRHWSDIVTIEEACARADTLRAQVWDILDGELISIGPRSQPLVAYVDLALEHQEAITVLARRGLYGSALVLARPVFEIFWRSNWVNLCATDAQVDEIRRNEFRFPNTADIVAQLDSAYRTGTFFKDLRANHWDTLNSYTHSGIRQLPMRFTATDLKPSYADEEIVAAVNGTSIMTALNAVMLLKAHNRDADGQRIEGLLQALDPGPPPEATTSYGTSSAL
jgi:hypothetical protein